MIVEKKKREPVCACVWCSLTASHIAKYKNAREKRHTKRDANTRHTLNLQNCISAPLCQQEKNTFNLEEALSKRVKIDRTRLWPSSSLQFKKKCCQTIHLIPNY